MRRFFAVALIALMGASPSLASGYMHVAADATGASHCHDDDTADAGKKSTRIETVDHHERHDTSTNSGTTQIDDCYTGCCGLACHASMAMLTGTFLMPSPSGAHLAPTAFAGIAQRSTDRIDRPPISRQ